jgi:CheY-like chemotaxis protein
MSDSPGCEKNILILKTLREKKDRIEEQLARLGCRVRFVAGVFETREALCGCPMADLLIVDIMDIGEENLKTLVNHVRSDPATARIPVVALLERDDIGAVAGALSAGCDDFLHKPVNYNILRGKVRSLLELLPRASSRVPCRIAVEAVSGGETMPGEIVEISPEGAGLLLEGLLGKGQVLNLEFGLASGPGTLVVGASVVHIEEAYGRYLHGVCFSVPDSETERKIKQYVQEAVSDGKPR